MVLGHFAAIVVGSGAGGGTVAGNLAPLLPPGSRVLLVERGMRFDNVDPTNSPRGLNTWHTQVGLTSFFKQGFQYLYTRDREFAFWQGMALGGGTRHYNAIACMPAEDDLAFWESPEAPGGGLPGFGGAWEEAEGAAIEQFHGNHEDPEAEWSTSDRCTSLALSRLRETGALDRYAVAGHTDELYELKGENWIERKRCVRCSHCIFGCRYEAKFGSYEACVRPAEEAGAPLTVLTGAQVKDVLVDAAGAVTGVLVETAPGRIDVALSPIVVVAGGWYYTPTLLQNSRVASLVNASGMLGKNLQAHPEEFVIGVLDRPRWEALGEGAPSLWPEPGVQTMLAAANVDDHHGTGVGHPRFHDVWDFHPVNATEPLLSAATYEVVRKDGVDHSTAPKLLMGADHKAVARVLARRSVASLVLAMRPRTVGEITPDGSISYPLAGESPEAEADRAVVRDMTSFAADVYEQGLGAKLVLRGNVPNPVHSHHQFGTCVMGRDPAKSVVAWGSGERANFETWGVKGLFVCDTSVIPSAPLGFPSGTMFVTARLAVEAILGSIRKTAAMGRLRIA